MPLSSTHDTHGAECDMQRHPSKLGRLAALSLVTSLIATCFCRADETSKLHFESKIVKRTVDSKAKSTEIQFHFENVSNAAVDIERIASSCGCFKAVIKDGKMSYKPGEKGEVTATFEVGSFMGTVEKNVVLWVDGDPAGQPSAVLKAQITIPEHISIQPKSLNWEIGSAAQPKKMSITVLEGHTLHIENVVSSNNHYQHELKTIENGRSYELLITPKDTEASNMAILNITTDSDVARFKRVQAFAMTK